MSYKINIPTKKNIITLIKITLLVKPLYTEEFHFIWKVKTV